MPLVNLLRRNENVSQTEKVKGGDCGDTVKCKVILFVR